VSLAKSPSPPTAADASPRSFPRPFSRLALVEAAGRIVGSDVRRELFQ
jgi:hypothetical protein